MSTTLRSIIEKFSDEDQRVIQRKARAMADEMISHAHSLAEVRSALVKTQDEVARVLQVKQTAVAQLEKRSDLLLSTLRKYVEAMGGELAVTVKTGSGALIRLDSLSSLQKPVTPKRARPAPAVHKPAVRVSSRAKLRPERVA